MKNHLEALNESFNKINIENTSAKLFEDFTGDESESGIDKEDILDWLSDHEQLWADCERHFHTDPNWLSADELESFICEHEQACKDYARAFGFSLEENLKEGLKSDIKLSPGKELTTKSGHKIIIDSVNVYFNPDNGSSDIYIDYSYKLADGEEGKGDYCTPQDLMYMLQEDMRNRI